jgi:hypothetical protein
LLAGAAGAFALTDSDDVSSDYGDNSGYDGESYDNDQDYTGSDEAVEPVYSTYSANPASTASNGGSAAVYGGSAAGYDGSTTDYGGSTAGYSGAAASYGGAAAGYGGAAAGYGGSTAGYTSSGPTTSAGIPIAIQNAFTLQQAQIVKQGAAAIGNVWSSY